MADSKRNEIRKKVSEAETRNQARAEPTRTDRAGEKAIEVKDKFTSFAREHPVVTVAGGLALGALVSSFFRGSPTRKAGRAIGKKTAGLAALAAEFAIAFAQQAYEATEDARRASADKLSGMSESVGDSARNLSADAADYAAEAADAVRKAGKSAFKSVRSRLH